MKVLPFALAVVVIVAVLIRPDLLPFAAAGIAAPAAMWAWERRRRARRDASVPTAPRASPRRTILAVLGVVVAVLLAGVILFTGDQQDAVDGPKPGPDPGPSLLVDGSYLARLQLGGDREMRILELVTVPASSLVPHLGEREARRVVSALRQVLRRRGWRVENLAGTGRRYRRLRTQKLDVSSFLPAERTNRFAPPRSIRVRLGPDETLTLLLEERSRVILDGPRNAIGDTFPAGKRQRGPGGGERIALGADEFGDPIEFEVRSGPFRNALLVKALDVTLWTPFGWILAITASLISDRVRGIITGLTKRLLDRIRRLRRPRRRTAGGAHRPSE